MTRLSLPLLAFLALLCMGAAQSPLQVDQPAICYQCHDDIEEELELPSVHTAFEEGTCSNCHNPHASKHATLLMDEPGLLCLSCHEDVGDDLAQTSAHAPAASGDCGRCHDPHASGHASQLTQAPTALCQSCHPQAASWANRAVVHSPVEDGDCQTCHAPHGSAHESLLANAAPALCFDCHDRDASFVRVHSGRDVGDANCSVCHDPHAAGLKGLLRENQHSPFEDGDCATCHPSSTTFAVSQIRPLCGDCHSEAEDFAKFEYQHNLDDERSCANCHNAHASNSQALLAADQATLCMKCHFNEPERKEKAAYVTHDGMDCSNCHSPHGSDNARYLNSLTVDLCVHCHEADHTASHPVGPEVIDARTEKPVTCLSCHQMHGSDFEKYLPLDPRMELCIQCHRK